MAHTPQRRFSSGSAGEGAPRLPRGGSPAPGWFVRDENSASNHSSRASSPGAAALDKGNIRMTIRNLAGKWGQQLNERSILFIASFCEHVSLYEAV